jgi:hypothetical protein
MYENVCPLHLRVDDLLRTAPAAPTSAAAAYSAGVSRDCGVRSSDLPVTGPPPVSAGHTVTRRRSPCPLTLRRARALRQRRSGLVRRAPTPSQRRRRSALRQRRSLHVAPGAPRSVSPVCRGVLYQITSLSISPHEALSARKERQSPALDSHVPFPTSPACDGDGRIQGPALSQRYAPYCHSAPEVPHGALCSSLRSSLFLAVTAGGTLMLGGM